MATSIDWSRGMAQDWSWWEVDPATWRDVRRVDGVLSASVTYELGRGTVSSGKIELEGGWPGEFWLRGYLEARQGRRAERVCVATLLCQTTEGTLTPTSRARSIDAYGPLLELSDDSVPIGWSLPAGANVITAAAALFRGSGHAPVVAPATSGTALSEPWVAGDDESVLEVGRALCALAGHEVTSDPWGRTAIEPELRVTALAPVATLDDSEVSGIVMAPVTERADWYKIPNVVEVVRSDRGRRVIGVAVNDEAWSPLSTVARGRRVVKRLVNPSGLDAGCSQEAVDLRAAQELAQASCLDRTVTYDRGFDPRIALGDCVRLDLPSVGVGCVGRSTRQEIDCSTGAKVRETVTWTERMWMP